MNNFKLKQEIRKLKEDIRKSNELNKELKKINFDISSNNEYLLIQNKKYKKHIKELRGKIIEMEKENENK